MAAKKSTKSKSLPERLEEIQTAASKQMHEAIDYLSTEPRKMVGELRADIEKTGKQWSRRTEKTVKDLRSDIDRRRKDLSKRAEKAVKDARKRAEAFAKDVRRGVEDAVEPVTTRLDVATRTDIDRLRKRLDQLEKRIGKMVASTEADSASKNAASS